MEPRKHPVTGSNQGAALQAKLTRNFCGRVVRILELSVPPGLELQPRRLAIYSRGTQARSPVLKATLPVVITGEKGSGLG